MASANPKEPSVIIPYCLSRPIGPPKELEPFALQHLIAAGCCQTIDYLLVWRTQLEDRFIFLAQVKVNLSLGAFGNVNTPVSLELPAGTPLQVNLKMNIPVSTTVSVNETVPVNFDQGLAIKLGKSELVPVVAELRGVDKHYVAIR